MPPDHFPRVSIILPTHNRRPRLGGALDAIARQRFALETVEVIVVADGCEDDTVEFVANFEALYSLKIVELPGCGPAVARNRGAEMARAPLLVFLDDDVEPLDTWLAAHFEQHERSPGGAVIGSYPPLPTKGDEFRRLVRHWWMQHFDELERPGHRFAFSDMLTGNLSISRKLWDDLGGLDPHFPRAREDYELGLRLVERGIPITHAPGAFSWHHEYETMTLHGALRRKREEGRSDVRLGIKHPVIKEHLDISRYWWTPGWRGRIGRCLFRWPALAVLAGALYAALAQLLSRVPIAGLFRRVFGKAQYVAYLRGAAAELKTLDAWRAYAEDRPQLRKKRLLIDLYDGIASAERKLAEAKPSVVRLMYGVMDIGWLPYAPAAEPWSASHLRAELTGRMAGGMLWALEEAGELLGPNSGRVPEWAAASQRMGSSRAARLFRLAGRGAAAVGSRRVVSPICPAARQGGRNKKACQ